MSSSQQVTEAFNKFIDKEISITNKAHQFFGNKFTEATPTQKDATIAEIFQAAQDNNRSLRLVLPNDRYDFGTQTDRVTVYAQPESKTKYKITGFKQG